MLDVISPPIEAATQAAQSGTPVTREYSPGTTLTDSRGREWTVTSYGTSAWMQGIMPPFEAQAIWRLEQLYGPVVVKTASAGHRSLRHPYGMPGCPNCPPLPCCCGDPECTDFEAHRREWAGAEQTWREAA